MANENVCKYYCKDLTVINALIVLYIFSYIIFELDMIIGTRLWKITNQCPNTLYISIFNT